MPRATATQLTHLGAHPVVLPHAICQLPPWTGEDYLRPPPIPLKIKKEGQRERTKRYRVSKHFRDQSDIHFVPVEREILDDGHFKNIQTNVSISRRELRTTKVMQLSEMKEIIGYGSSGRRGNRFQGAIVSDLSGRTIYGVQEGLFVVNVNCRAKHGLHSGAEFFFARRNSGIVNEYALISWDDKPNKLYWRPKSSIEDSPVEETK